jgi:dCTP deaminase
MMATEYRMIEPYEAGQVKEVKGQRIVSYGTSSYGYDIRCADEFKLFTNINSTIVDPKEFGRQGRFGNHSAQQFRARAHG